MAVIQVQANGSREHIMAVIESQVLPSPVGSVVD